MRIENIIRLTDGLLQNFPSVDQIESIQINPSKIKRGDLFLDINNSAEDQKRAVQNGAYAIISEKISDILDLEIAWIQVDSLRLACIKLTRYDFSKKNSKILFLDDISMEIIQNITKSHEYEELSSNVYETLMTIKKSGENVKYTCSDERLALSIDPSCQRVDNICNVQKFDPRSPFYAAFACNGNFYNNIKIPNIFVDKLSIIIAYLKEKKIYFNVHNLTLCKHFSPIFIDYGLNKKEFGQSEKVVIFEKSMDFLDFEIKYLSGFTKEFITCVPNRYRNYFSNYKNMFLFSNSNELKDLITKNFRYFLILGEKKNFEDIFKHDNENNRSLF